MKKVSAVLVSGLVAFTVLTTAVSPALALGGCGPNAHRGYGGRCYFGGQNQGWCMRRTGHAATRMPNGELVCFQ